MEAEAIVREVAGLDAVVEMSNRTGGCGRCHEPGGCGGGSGLFGQFFGSRRRVFRVANSIDAQVGDRVLVLLSEGEVFRTALAVYFLPVLLLVVGAFAGMAINTSPGDGAAFLGGFVGFAVGVAGAFWFQTRARDLGQLKPVLARRSSCSGREGF